MRVFLLSALRVTLRVHDKEQKIFGTICYLTPLPRTPPPLLKIMNSEQC